MKKLPRGEQAKLVKAYTERIEEFLYGDDMIAELADSMTEEGGDLMEQVPTAERLMFTAIMKLATKKLRTLGGVR